MVNSYFCQLVPFQLILAPFGVLPMVPLVVILPMVTIGSQWSHWLTNGTNCTVGRANGTIGITIGTNGITNGTIGKTLNDIGIPLVPLGNPERTHFFIGELIPFINSYFGQLVLFLWSIRTFSLVNSYFLNLLTIYYVTLL